MSGGQQQERRTSIQPTNMTTTPTGLASAEADPTSTKQQSGKENKRPLITVLSEQRGTKKSESEDENDEVIPSWPTKQEQQLARNASSEFIQHKVYSLKDYSQVNSPTSISSSTAVFQQPTHSQPISSGSAGAGKLLKSMSQDRKVKPSNKRMSECIYPASQISAAQSLFSSAAGTKSSSSASVSPPDSSMIAAANSSTGQSASFSMGLAASTNTPMPANATRGPQVAANSGIVVGESRIDRMRKLFVSPLSLRSSASGSSTSGSAAAVSAMNQSGASAESTSNSVGLKQREPRLSLQAASSAKPSATAHHLMHAMHRSAAGSATTTGLAQAIVAHHSRRSPMRQKQSKGFRVYGCPLQMANNIYPITCFGRADIYKQQSVPYVLARLCNYIEENSSQLTHEGIFRVSGNARLMEKLRTLFDHLGDAPLESESVDVATSASMLKMYLRELPEPLIPTRMNYYFITLAKKYAPHLIREQASSTSHALQQQKQQADAIRAGSSKTLASSSTTSISTGAEESVSSNNNSQYVRQRLAFSRDLTKLIRKLPIENYNLLKYLACFLYRISLKQQYNKMCAEALGIVFGPNVFRIRSESYKGLKEQELSNQIMASIISNYKLIFDSELTDPLGNVVDGTDNSLMATAAAISEAVEQQKRKQQLQPGDHLKQSAVSTDKRQTETVSSAETTSADLLAQADRLAERASSMQAKLVSTISVSSQDIATPKGETRPPMQAISDIKDTCCPGRCKDFVNNSNEGHKLSGHLVDVVDDENDDCDDDDEESYTPSSGSGSYCSSMDSQTLESSYEGDGDPDGRRASRLAEDLTSRSTSECASDTSYTPTSSHTDSDVPDDEDEDDESFEDQVNSSRESSVSNNNQLLKSSSNAPSSSVTQGAKVDCRVCKRRESMHITNLAHLEELNGYSQVDRASEKKAQAPPAESPDNELVPQLKPIRQSHRSADLSPKPVQRKTNPLLRRRSSSASSLNGRRSSDGVRHRHNNRVENYRRRLLELLNNEEAVEGTSKPRIKSSALISSSRRSKTTGATKRDQHSWESKRQNRHSTRSRNLRQTKDLSIPVKAGPRTSNNDASGVPASGVTRKAVPVCGLDLPDVQAAAESISIGAWSEIFTRHLADEAAVVAAAQYEESDSPTRYFLMRSFNSDETLLRSLNYHSDWSGSHRSTADFSTDLGLELELNQTSQKQAMAIQRRRYSNFDFISDKSESSMANVARPCDYIFEALDLAEEAESSVSCCEQQTHKQMENRQSPVNCERSRPFETSAISLIDNKMGFRKSELSINNLSEQRGLVARPHDEDNIEDPVFVQMTAAKDLAKTLKKLLKLGRSQNLSTKTERLLLKFASSEEGTNSVCQSGSSNQDGNTDTDWIAAYSDDSLACYVDHLSARGFIEELAVAIAKDEQLSEHSDEVAADRMDRLCKILTVKITLFKQRYNDLKSIRDHYLRHHANGALMTALKKLTGCSDQSQEVVESYHGSLDTLKIKPKQHRRLVGASISSGHRSRILSVPNRELFAQSPRGDSRSKSAMATNEPEPEIPVESRRDQLVLDDRAGGNCRFGSLCPVEFVFNIEKQLASKRIVGNRVVKLNQMTPEQLQSEKLELQKNLLRYEYWFGRPVTRLEFSLIGHLYERYRAVKVIKQRKKKQILVANSSPTPDQ